MSAPENKKLGLLSIVLLGINGIIGSGIFLLPGKMMTLTGNWSVFVYIFTAVIVFSIAWCFAQCATLFHQNGGAYVYAKAAFGNFIGFEIGLMRWVSGIIAWACIIVGFITALSSIWPNALEEPTRSLLVLSLTGGLGIANLLGVPIMKGLNNIITVAKIVPLLFFVLVGIFYIEQAHLLPAIEQKFPTETFGGASLLIFYAFGGFESIAIAAEDMKNPTKNIPLAVMLVIGFCSLLYFLIQMIAIGILGPDLIGSATPIAKAAEKLFGSVGKWFVTIGMLISTGGINIAASFVTPRSGVALADDQMISPIVGMKNRFGTPSLAILITVILTAFIALSGSFTQLVAISVIARFTQYVSTCLAVVVFQRARFANNKLTRQPWKLFIPIFALAGILWLLSHATFSQLYWSWGILILGIPLYFLQKLKNVPEKAAPAK